MDLVGHLGTMARLVREVNLLCNAKTFCSVKSQILITDQKVYDLRVAIGQIFNKKRFVPYLHRPKVSCTKPSSKFLFDPKKKKDTWIACLRSSCMV